VYSGANPLLLDDLRGFYGLKVRFHRQVQQALFVRAELRRRRRRIRCRRQCCLFLISHQVWNLLVIIVIFIGPNVWLLLPPGLRPIFTPNLQGLDEVTTISATRNKRGGWWIPSESDLLENFSLFLEGLRPG
jgi:hypothetical protein